MMAKENLQNPQNHRFLIEGKLTDVHVALDTEELLKKVEAYYKQASVIKAGGAAKGDIFARAADAVLQARCGVAEYAQNFVGLIDQQVVYGEFGGAGFLKSGNQVKMLVSRQGDVLVADAIIDPKQGYLWVMCTMGWAADNRACWKLVLFIYISAIIFLCVLQLFHGTPGKFFEEMKYWAVGLAVTLLLVPGRDCSGKYDAPGSATATFRMLGFAEPEKVDLHDFALQWMLIKEDSDKSATRPHGLHLGTHEHCHVFCYKKAIEAGKLALIEPADDKPPSTS